VVVVRQAQDAKKDITAALINYVAAADPEVSLVLAHAGGAKGKALADAMRAAGARTVEASRITRHRERVDFVRDEVRRLGGKCPEDAAEALGSQYQERAAGSFGRAGVLSAVPCANLYVSRASSYASACAITRASSMSTTCRATSPAR